jgi:translation initiation factor IF-2
VPVPRLEQAEGLSRELMRTPLSRLLLAGLAVLVAFAVPFGVAAATGADQAPHATAKASDAFPLDRSAERIQVEVPAVEIRRLAAASAVPTMKRAKRRRARARSVATSPAREQSQTEASTPAQAPRTAPAAPRPTPVRVTPAPVPRTPTPKPQRPSGGGGGGNGGGGSQFDSTG